MKRLYERLGGEDGINNVVLLFYIKLLKDERISHFFVNTDIEAQVAKQKLFLNMVLVGLVIILHGL